MSDKTGFERVPDDLPGAPRRTALAALIGICAALLGADLAAAQPPARQTFEDEERVIAIDLVIDVRNPADRTPDNLGRDDLIVLEDETELTVVGVAPLARGPETEPWTIVVYFDLRLASAATVNAAALAVAEAAGELAELGTVEVVVAAPRPRTLLAPSRDVNAIEGALSRIVLEREGVNSVTELRTNVLAELGDYPDLDRTEVAESAVRAEEALVQAQNDALIGWVAARPTAGPKALFLVRDGYDLDPSEFYRRQLAGVGAVGSGVKVLGASTTDAARVLAGYGWPTFVLAFSDVSPGTAALNRKFDEFRRQGLYGAKGDKASSGTFSVPLRRRDKNKEEAEEAAVEQKPAGALLDAVPPLNILVRETGGRLIAEAAELPSTVDSLADRVRITFQVSRVADGRLRSVVVRPAKRGLKVTAPGWIRSATPQAVAEARVRRILDGDFDEGDLVVSARYSRATPTTAADGAAAGRLTVGLDLELERPETQAPDRSTVRLTVAHGGEGEDPAVSHHLLLEQDLTKASWDASIDLDVPDGHEYLIVIVEELGSGAWGSRVVEL